MTNQRLEQGDEILADDGNTYEIIADCDDHYMVEWFDGEDYFDVAILPNGKFL
jgi:hypothetical protein